MDKDVSLKIIRLLLLRSHGYPGIRGSELKRILKTNLSEALKKTSKRLEPLGLEIKAVTDEGEIVDLSDEGKLLNAKIGIVLKDSLTEDEFRSTGFRIDELAVLTTAIVYILSLGGKASRKAIIDFLKDKIQEWRIDQALNKFVKLGYLREENENVLSIGWRTYMEINIEKLVKSLATSTS